MNADSLLIDTYDSSGTESNYNVNLSKPLGPIPGLNLTPLNYFSSNSYRADDVQDRSRDVTRSPSIQSRDVDSKIPAFKLRIPCTNSTRTKSFTRRSDMVRHARKRDTSTQKSPYTVVGC